MPDTPSVSEQVSAAVDAAVAQHSESPSLESTAPSTPSATPAETTAPADPSGIEGSSTSAGPTDEAATTQPTSEDDTTIKNDAGWKELESRRQILTNARTKGAAEFARQVEGRLGVSLADENQIANVRAFMEDPRGYIQQFAQHYGLTPQPSAPAQTPTPHGFVRPQPTLSTTDGIPAYAAPEIDAVIDHLFGQIQQMQQSLQPIQQSHESLEQERIAASSWREANADYAEMSKWEGFKENQKDILALMRSDKRVTAESAYRRVLQTKYLPSQEQRIRQRVLDEIQKKSPQPPKSLPASVQTRGNAGEKRSRGMDVDDAIKFAVEKHSQA